MALPWTALTNGAHTRLWEHLNNLAAALMPGPRHYVRGYHLTSSATGTTVGTLVIPAQPYDALVKLRVTSQSQAATAAPGYAGLVISTSAGTLALNAVKDISYAPVGAYSVGNVYGATLDLDAGTAATLTLTTFSASANEWWAELEADIWFDGEWA